jgi:hypothetical protein
VINALAAALIGVGGSVVGAAIGGWFGIMAARGQWKRDRADARAERSRQAAMAIAESVASLEEALVAWSAGQSDLVALRTAFNVFSRTAAVQSIALTESTLRERVRRHIELVARVATLAETNPTGAAALVPTARRHADAVIEALDAHYNDAALPSYRPLPLEDAAALLTWPSAAAQGNGQPLAESPAGDAGPAPGGQGHPA